MLEIIKKETIVKNTQARLSKFYKMIVNDAEIASFVVPTHTHTLYFSSTLSQIPS